LSSVCSLAPEKLPFDLEKELPLAMVPEVAGG